MRQAVALGNAIVERFVTNGWREVHGGGQQEQFPESQGDQDFAVKPGERRVSAVCAK
jgi:hypothetical protein